MLPQSFISQCSHWHETICLWKQQQWRFLTPPPLFLLQTSPPQETPLKRHSATVEPDVCVCVSLPELARCARHSSIHVCVSPPHSVYGHHLCVCVFTAINCQSQWASVCVLWSLPTTSHHSTTEVTVYRQSFHIRNMVEHKLKEYIGDSVRHTLWYIRESVDSLCRDGADAQYMLLFSCGR